MFEVTITARRREYRRALPERWKDVPEARRLAWWRLWMTDPQQAPARILKEILHLPRWLWRTMSIEDAAALTARLEWMTPAPGCEDMPIQSFRHGLRRYYLPRPKFENGTCLEFVLADGYYKEFVETGNPELLLKMTATLCRPRKLWRRARLTSGDERTTLLQKEEVDERARQLATLDPAIQAAVMLYFEGVKRYVADMYWMLFDDKRPPTPEDQPPEEQEAPSSEGPRFGWWSIFMQVDKDGVFSQYGPALQLRLHKVLIYLVDQHDINEKQRQEMERLRSKNNTSHS